ncbi:MAG: hypothetical protein PCFJNLEI_03724 [Verrucomicrobiae bacterium]|nr:hypothetical protein [Verrucomicrobiae bacterium]
MALKSSWELALERTGGKTAGKLTDAQKTKLAELEKLYTAKIAQEELTLKPRIATAKPEDAAKLEETLRNEIAKLRRKLEEEKDKVRQSG